CYSQRHGNHQIDTGFIKGLRHVFVLTMLIWR
ncbi:MAG: hypothetical protein ACI8Z9_002111, partial [Paraglaciecola sp.]